MVVSQTFPLSLPRGSWSPPNLLLLCLPFKVKGPLFPRCLDQNLIPCFISQPHPIHPQVLSALDSSGSVLSPLPPLVSELLLCPTWMVAALPPPNFLFFHCPVCPSHGTFQLSTISHGSHHTQKQIPTPHHSLKISVTPACDSFFPPPPAPAPGSSHFALGLLLGHAQLLPISEIVHLPSCVLECRPPDLLGLVAFSCLACPVLGTWQLLTERLPNLQGIGDRNRAGPAGPGVGWSVVSPPGGAADTSPGCDLGSSLQIYSLSKASGPPVPGVPGVPGGAVGHQLTRPPPCPSSSGWLLSDVVQGCPQKAGRKRGRAGCPQLPHLSAGTRWDPGLKPCGREPRWAALTQ